MPAAKASEPTLPTIPPLSDLSPKKHWTLTLSPVRLNLPVILFQIRIGASLDNKGTCWCSSQKDFLQFEKHHSKQLKQKLGKHISRSNKSNGWI